MNKGFFFLNLFTDLFAYLFYSLHSEPSLISLKCKENISNKAPNMARLHKVITVSKQRKTNENNVQKHTASNDNGITTSLLVRGLMHQIGPVVSTVNLADKILYFS